MWFEDEYLLARGMSQDGDLPPRRNEQWWCFSLKNCWWKKSDQPVDMNKYHIFFDRGFIHIYIYNELFIISYHDKCCRTSLISIRCPNKNACESRCIQCLCVMITIAVLDRASQTPPLYHRLGWDCWWLISTSMIDCTNGTLRLPIILGFS